MTRFQTLPVLDAWFPVRHVLRSTATCAFECPFCPAPSESRSGKTVYDFENPPPPALRVGLGAGRDEFFDGADGEKRRKALSFLSDSGYGLLALTRSPLAARSLKLFSNTEVPSGVVFSFSGVDGEGGGPKGPPSVESRLEALKTMSQAGIVTGYFLSPLDGTQPDAEGQMHLALEQARDAGAHFAMMDFRAEPQTPDDTKRELSKRFEWGALERGMAIRPPYGFARSGLDGRDQAILALHHAWMYFRLMGKERTALAHAALAINWTTTEDYLERCRRGSLKQIRGVGPYIEAFLHRVFLGEDPVAELEGQVKN